jgi:SAM-dependent methyltransferase
VNGGLDAPGEAGGASPRGRAAERVPGYDLLRAVWRRALGYQPVMWSRVVMDRETLRLVARLDPASLSVLEISGQRWKSMLPFKRYESVSWPDYDVCAAPLPGGRYDLVIAEQVFEHLRQPGRAGRNVYAMLNPGGRFLLTTPFLLRVHHAPVDCTRWTETGLRHFLVECGFAEEAIETGSWGNRACVRANLAKWTHYLAGVHSLRNEPEFPVVVWAMARKAEHA